jgi:hypothetical protein
MTAREEIEEIVQSALVGLGIAWKRREAGWFLSATKGMPFDITLTVEDEVWIEATLASWEEIGQRQRTALCRLFERAQTEWPGVDFILAEKHARVRTSAGKQPSERVVVSALGRVAGAGRLLSREVSALLDAELAERYLRFCGGADERGPTPDRM